MPALLAVRKLCAATGRALSVVKVQTPPFAPVPEPAGMASGHGLGDTDDRLAEPALGRRVVRDGDGGQVTVRARPAVGGRNAEERGAPCRATLLLLPMM